MLRRALLASMAAAPLASRALAQATHPVLGLMSGELGGTFVQIAADLSALMEPVVHVDVHLAAGSVRNLIDLAKKPGIDLATAAVDALPYIKQQQMLPANLAAGICYIVKLYDNDVHVMAGPDIKQFSDLDGKPTNIDVPGAGTNLTLRTIFAAYGIKPEFHEDPPAIAKAKLQRGEIAAFCYCIGKPGPIFATMPAGTDLHLVPVPYDPDKLGVYVPAGKFTHADYPTLVPENAPVSTVGVGVVLAAFNFTPSSPRYRTLATFTDYLFGHFDELLKPGHHPKWRDVNLAANQPGWPRFPEAQAWLDQRSRAAELDRLAQKQGLPPLTPAQRQQLFEEYRVWEQKRSGR